MDSRLVRALVVVTAALTLGGGTGLGGGRAAPTSVTLSARAAADPVVAAAGDIACDPADPSFNNGNGTATACRQKATAALLAGATNVLPLGDTQYESGEFPKYGQSYGRHGGTSWGTYLAITRPAPGNHEYQSSGATGYFNYFGAAAGDPLKGYYSFDLGSWHLIALNSEVGAGATSAQVQWLRTDLRATTKPCILAYWHKPRFSSGSLHGDNPSFDAFWRALYDYRADVVLNGHDHNYERFAPQNPDAAPDPLGIREFVVGTGGKNLRTLGTVRANSEVRATGTYGVLKLTLRANSYDWRFVPVAGQTFSDMGTTTCNGVPTAVKPSGCRAGFWRSGRDGRLRYICLRRR